MRAYAKPRNLQSGQATLETVLVLAVTLLIVLGLLYRFNTAFKKYTVDLYGSYYRCLLETGELPGVGSVCKDKQTRFDIASGRELRKAGPSTYNPNSGRTDNSSIGSGPGSGSGSGSSGPGGSGPGSGGPGSGSGGSGPGSGSGKSGTSGSTAGSGEGSGDGSGSGDNGSETVGGSSSSSGGGRGSVVARLRNSGRSRSTSMGSATAAAGAGEGEEKPEPLTAYSSSSSSRSGDDALRRAKTKMDFKMDGSEYQRAETAAVSPVAASSTNKKDKDTDSLRPRKVAESADRKPTASHKEGESGGMDFGRIFRMFLIFGIIVGIVIFLGGQVLQISKSGED